MSKVQCKIVVQLFLRYVLTKRCACYFPSK